MPSFESEIRRTAERFGIREFRPLQKEIILSILEKRHTLAVLPTGAGKSITYQIPAFLLEGLTLVVTPLVSLMKDQVRVLKERGADRCEYLSSDRTPEEKNAVQDNIRGWKILYVTPERLENPAFAERLKRAGVRIPLVVIDEAHCVSLWGNSFRPSYRRIRGFLDRFPETTAAAFTGTASAALREDIRAGLGIKKWNVIAAPMIRGNISVSVKWVTDKTHFILDRAAENENTIVYTSSKFACNRLHYTLRHMGFPAAVYHADLPKDERDENQRLFLKGEKSIMVATSAFGMGIDKRDIRRIYHFNLPTEVEEYYQEIGRAGRDGGESSAVTLVEPDDPAAVDGIIAESYPDWKTVKILLSKKKLLPSDREQVKAVSETLSLGSFEEIRKKKDEYLLKRNAVLNKALEMKRFAAGGGCRMVDLLRLFGEEASPCGKCDHCLAVKKEFYRKEWTDEEAKLAAVLAGFRKGIPAEGLRRRALGNQKADQWKSGFGTLRGTDRKSFWGIVCNLKNYHVLCLDPENYSVVLNPLFVDWARSISPFSFF